MASHTPAAQPRLGLSMCTAAPAPRIVSVPSATSPLEHTIHCLYRYITTKSASSCLSSNDLPSFLVEHPECKETMRKHSLSDLLVHKSGVLLLQWEVDKRTPGAGKVKAKPGYQVTIQQIPISSKTTCKSSSKQRPDNSTNSSTNGNMNNSGNKNKNLDSSKKTETRFLDEFPALSSSSVQESSVYGFFADFNPENFYCPISNSLMLDPVTSPAGVSFERHDSYLLTYLLSFFSFLFFLIFSLFIYQL